MTEIPISNCQEWLNNLKLDDIPKRKVWQRSLMDITGIKHHENMWSDIYSFFFNVNEKHGMKDLFIRSFEQVARIEARFLENFKIEREYVVDDQKRIDLLLKDQQKHNAVIIENKVYHTLTNDLGIYYKTVKKGEDNVKVVVLGLTKYKLNNYKSLAREEVSELNKDYRSITHLELLNKVRENLPRYLEGANPEFLYLFQEFYKNVKNHSNMITEEAAFFFKEGNQEKIVRMHDIYSKIKEYVIMVIECQKDESPLKKYITEDLKLIPCLDKSQKEKHEYIKYMFKKRKEQQDMMLTVVYKKSILRPDKGESPHIEVILEIQGMIKEKVESDKEHFKSLLNTYKDIKYDGKKGKDWWHYASMNIYLNNLEEDIPNIADVISSKINKDCSLLKLGNAILDEINNTR